jgi:hypothetical protein
MAVFSQLATGRERLATRHLDSMARSQNDQRYADASWRSRYSLPSVEEALRQQREVLSQHRPRVASQRSRVNPAERPPEPPESNSKSDDDKRKAKAGSR